MLLVSVWLVCLVSVGVVGVSVCLVCVCVECVWLVHVYVDFFFNFLILFASLFFLKKKVV